jgi:glycosyltransferase involved in cell wall biosynthesis
MGDPVAALPRIPLVSVVIPMRDEARYIGDCVRSVLEQNYPRDRLEVIVADGCSADGSAEIVRGIGSKHSNLTVCDNPRRTTSFGLNEGIRRARGDLIVILGSHSTVPEGFIEENVRALRDSGAEAAGGVIEAVAENDVGRAIAAAVSSRFGVGDIPFRQSNEASFVDTIAFAAYRRGVFEEIGLFDEELVRNQDDELNYRLRKTGGRLFLTPRIRSRYFSRPTFRGLWRQYFLYGLWKVRVFQKHARVMRPRHFVPAASVAAGLGALVAGVFDCRMLIGAAALAVAYALGVAAASVAIARRLGWRYLPSLAIAFPILHFSYGLGFLVGLVRFLPRWWRPESEPPRLGVR